MVIKILANIFKYRKHNVLIESEKVITITE